MDEEIEYDMERVKGFLETIQGDQRSPIKLPIKGMLKLSHIQSEKMYRQNRDKYQNIYRRIPGKPFWDGKGSVIIRTERVSFPDSCEIEVGTISVDKFTIIELTCKGKHYHGLSARAECDDDDVMTGVYNAYHRAFKSMIGV